MARHVDPNDTSFRRSVLRAAAGGAAALILTFAITAALMRMGRIDSTDTPAMVATGTPTVTAQVTSIEPTPEPEPSPDPEPAPTTPPPTTPAPAPTETTENPVSGVTVQVLEQVGAGPQAAEAAEVLRELGYDVVATNVTDRQVETTTVLASPGAAAAAEQLQELDPRFTFVGDNDGFSTEVELHVIVGADFSG